MSGPEMMEPMRRVFMNSPVARPGRGMTCWNMVMPIPMTTPKNHALSAWSSIRAAGSDTKIIAE